MHNCAHETELVGDSCRLRRMTWSTRWQMWTPFRTRRSSMRSLPQSLTPSALAATILWLSLGPTKAEKELSGLTEAPLGAHHVTAAIQPQHQMCRHVSAIVKKETEGWEPLSDSGNVLEAIVYSCARHM